MGRSSHTLTSTRDRSSRGLANSSPRIIDPSRRRRQCIWARNDKMWHHHTATCVPRALYRARCEIPDCTVLYSTHHVRIDKPDFRGTLGMFDRDRVSSRDPCPPRGHAPAVPAQAATGRCLQAPSRRLHAPNSPHRDLAAPQIYKKSRNEPNSPSSQTLQPRPNNGHSRRGPRMDASIVVARTHLPRQRSAPTNARRDGIRPTIFYRVLACR